MGKSKKIVVGTVSYRVGTKIGVFGTCVIGSEKEVLKEITEMLVEQFKEAVETRSDVRIELLNIHYLKEAEGGG